MGLFDTLKNKLIGEDPTVDPALSNQLRKRSLYDISGKPILGAPETRKALDVQTKYQPTGKITLRKEPYTPPVVASSRAREEAEDIAPTGLDKNLYKKLRQRGWAREDTLTMLPEMKTPYRSAIIAGAGDVSTVAGNLVDWGESKLQKQKNIKYKAELANKIRSREISIEEAKKEAQQYVQKQGGIDESLKQQLIERKQFKTLDELNTLKKYSSLGGKLQKYGEKLQEENTDYAKLDKLGDFDYKDLFNPDFYSTKGARTLSFTATLIPAALAGAYAGSYVGATVGMGAFGISVLSAIGATLLSRPIESAMEGADTFGEAKQKGLSTEEADKAANAVFKKNLSLAGLDVIEFLLAFGPLKKLGINIPIGVTRTGALATSYGLEHFEEKKQFKFQREALGEEYDPKSPEAREAGVLGGLMGLGMGGSGQVYNYLKDKVYENLDDTNKKIVDNAVPLGEEATLQAFDKIAETENGKSAIQKVATLLQGVNKVLSTKAGMTIEEVKTDKEGKPIIEEVKPEEGFELLEKMKKAGTELTEKLKDETLKGKKEEMRLDKQPILKSLEDVVGKDVTPETKITVYRAGTDKIKIGEQVTTDKANAEKYQKLRKDSKVFQSEIVLKDLVRNEGLRTEFIYAPKKEKPLISFEKGQFKMKETKAQLPTTKQAMKKAELKTKEQKQYLRGIKKDIQVGIKETQLFPEKLKKELEKKIRVKSLIIKKRMKIQEVRKVGKEFEKRIAEVKIERTKRKGELTKLRVGIEQRIKGIARGMREGAKITRDTIVSVQKELRTLVKKSDLEAKDRDKFTDKIRSIATAKDPVAKMEEILPEIESKIKELEQKASTRSLKSKINAELKKPKVKKGEKGSLTPEYEMLRNSMKQIFYDGSKIRTQTENELLLKDIEQRIEDRGTDNPVDFQDLVTHALLTESTKGLNEMSVGELDGVLTRIKQTKAIARDSFLWKQIERVIKLQKNVENSVENMSTEPMPNIPADNRKRYRDYIKQFVSRADITDRGYAQIINLLDSIKGGRFFRDVLYQPISEANKKFFVRDQNRKEKDKKFLSDLFKTKGTLLDRKIKGMQKQKHIGEFVDGEGKKVNLFFSDYELIDLSISAKMKDNRNAMKTSGIYIGGKNRENRVVFITNEILRVAQRKMSNEAKGITEFIAKQVSDKSFARDMTDAYEKKYNKPFPFVQGGYWSMPRRYMGAKKEGGDMFHPEQTGRGLPSPSSFKQRVKNDNPLILKNGWNKYLNWWSDVARFIEYDSAFVDIKATITNPEVKSEFTELYGANSYKQLLDSFDWTAKGGLATAEVLGKPFTYIQQILSVKFIGFKVRNVLSQGTSAIAAIADIPIKDFTKGTKDFIARPMVAYNKMMESPLIKYRHDRADFTKGMLLQETEKMQKYGTSPSKLAMVFTKVGDMVGVMGTGYIVYDYNYNQYLKQGMDAMLADKFALQDAENFIISTQQSSLPEYANAIKRAHPAVRTLGVFQQAQSMYRAKGYEAMNTWLKNDKKWEKENFVPMAKKVITYHFTLPALYEMSRGNFNPISIASKTVMSPISGFMGWGKIVEWGIMYALVMSLVPLFGGDEDEWKKIIPFDPSTLVGESKKLYERTIQSFNDYIKGEADRKDLFTLIEGSLTLLKIPAKNITEEYMKIEDLFRGDKIIRLLETEWQSEQRKKRKEAKSVEDIKKDIREDLEEGRMDVGTAKLKLKKETERLRKREEKERLGFDFEDYKKDLVERLESKDITVVEGKKELVDYLKKNKDELTEKIEEPVKNPSGMIDDLLLLAKATYHDPESVLKIVLTGEKFDRPPDVGVLKAIFSDQPLLKVSGDAVRFEREEVEITEALKKKWGVTGKEVRLDHTIPLQLGGDNSKKNLKIVITETHANYTPVENFLGRKLRAGEINEREAKKLITDFKEGKMTAKEVYDYIVSP